MQYSGDSIITVQLIGSYSMLNGFTFYPSVMTYCCASVYCLLLVSVSFYIPLPLLPVSCSLSLHTSLLIYSYSFPPLHITLFFAPHLHVWKSAPSESLRFHAGLMRKWHAIVCLSSVSRHVMYAGEQRVSVVGGAELFSTPLPSVHFWQRGIILKRRKRSPEYEWGLFMRSFHTTSMSHDS